MTIREFSSSISTITSLSLVLFVIGLISLFPMLINNEINDQKENYEISFTPTRVLMQDFTGVPAVADLAAMRNALKDKGIDPNKINPLSRVDLVIDHSVMVDHFGTENAYKENVKKAYYHYDKAVEYKKDFILALYQRGSTKMHLELNLD